MTKADTSNPDAAQQAEPLMMCEIITNGIIIGDAHHAAGKRMALPRATADALLAIDPPAIKVVGVTH